MTENDLYDEDEATDGFMQEGTDAFPPLISDSG